MLMGLILGIIIGIIITKLTHKPFIITKTYTDVINTEIRNDILIDGLKHTRAILDNEIKSRAEIEAIFYINEVLRELK